MKTSTKLVLLGAGVHFVAEHMADNAMKLALKEPDDLKRARHEQRAQALTNVTYAADAALWYGIYQDHPKLAVGVGSVLIALTAAPTVIRWLGPNSPGHLFAPSTAPQGAY